MPAKPPSGSDREEKPAGETKKKSSVTSATVRMYRMGTGDCFVITFHSQKKVTYRMMIDCGACSGSEEHFSKYIPSLKKHVGGRVNALVITHEHNDHVLGFERCRELFIKTAPLEVDEVWMAWCENDGNPEAEKLRDEMGKRKSALAMASQKYEQFVNDPGHRKAVASQYLGMKRLEAERSFSDTLASFTELNMTVSGGGSINPLPGMDVVKKDLKPKGKRRYFKPGEIIRDVPGLEGVRIYVLGPPTLTDDIKKEHAHEEGESFPKNPFHPLHSMTPSDAFMNAMNADTASGVHVHPFDDAYLSGSGRAYDDPHDSWRRIENDWLAGAGSLAIRLTEGQNNLSLVLAIEFIESGRVMLFPGDAEYGSWASWHSVDWSGAERREATAKKPLVEDLLNRTVFYKMAHHFSNNGTADRKGLRMMNHRDLTVMATLDYGIIGSRWKNTMPNWRMAQEIISRAKGRLIIMNTAGIGRGGGFPSLEAMITEGRSHMLPAEAEEFNNALKINDLWIDFTVKG